MKPLPVGFFQNMPVIRVLDLEGNRKLKELPPEICRLESLEYLNLGYTSIKEMPVELKNLTKLRCLTLEYIYGLQVVPPNVICCLPNLLMFSMILDSVPWHIKKYEEGFMVTVLQELECLQYLSWISISLPTVSDVQKFLTSQKLQKWIRNLQICECQDLTEMELPLSTLQRMRSLELDNCDHLERVKIKMGNGEKQVFSPSHISKSKFLNLVRVLITGCRFLNLTWLVYAPSLEWLMVTGSDKMEEIIGSDEGGNSEIKQQFLSIFLRLEKLCLKDLPNLKSIYSRALPFPSLRKIKVIRCPNLRKLPLKHSNSATNTLEIIEGEPSWWEELEWEDDNLEGTFTPYFKKW